MSRPPRTDHAGAWFHISNKGADGQDLFVDDVDRKRFISFLADAVERWGIEVHAYCLMSNHVHLLVHSVNGTVAEAMHHLFSRYARWHNYRHDRSGPVFDRRYHSVAVGSTEQALTAIRYIHRNPLSFVLAADLPDYPWSSLPVYLDRAGVPDWLTAKLLGVGAGESPSEVLSFVLQTLPSDATPAHGWLPPSVDHDDIESVVAALVGEPIAATTAVRGRPNHVLTLIVMLSVELRVGKTACIAERYGFKSASSVRTVARRGRTWVASRPGFAELRVAALQELGRAA